MEVTVGVSARHVHLKQNDLELLFGKNYKLNKFKDLTQPGQFACEEKVIIKTPTNTIENVRVLGPTRSYTQIEISKTDAYHLGINPPVRRSGELQDSETVTLIGPKGEIATQGCIIANRHIHINNTDLIKYNLNNSHTVKIRVNGEKSGIIGNVMVKASDNFIFELHIDCDDANAHLIKQGDSLEIIRDNNE